MFQGNDKLAHLVAHNRFLAWHEFRAHVLSMCRRLFHHSCSQFCLCYCLFFKAAHLSLNLVLHVSLYPVLHSPDFNPPRYPEYSVMRPFTRNRRRAALQISATVDGIDNVEAFLTYGLNQPETSSRLSSPSRSSQLK